MYLCLNNYPLKYLKPNMKCYSFIANLYLIFIISVILALTIYKYQFNLMNNTKQKLRINLINKVH